MDRPNFTVQQRHPDDITWSDADCGFHNKVSADAFIVQEREWDRENLNEGGPVLIYDYRVIDKNTGDIFTTLGTGA